MCNLLYCNSQLLNKANLSDLTAVTGLIILIKIWLKLSMFLARVPLKFDGWPRKTIGHLFYTMSSFVHYFIVIGEFKLELHSGHGQFGSKSVICFPCDLEIWWMILKINRAPPLYHVKLCASFQSHQCIQTGVTAWARSIRVKNGDFCPVWPWNLMDELAK